MEDRKESLVQEKERQKKPAKPYSTPKLSVHGPIEEITKGSTSANPDLGFTGSQ